MLAPFEIKTLNLTTETRGLRERTMVEEFKHLTLSALKVSELRVKNDQKLKLMILAEQFELWLNSSSRSQVNPETL